MIKQQNPTDEEYEVYSTALTKVYPVKEGELVVLCERTRSVKLLDVKDKKFTTKAQSKLNAEEIIGLEFPEVERATIRDFIKKNKIGGILKPKFHLSAPQAVLSKAEEDRLWKRRGSNVVEEGWRTFHDRYPRAGGLLRFSRVGLDRSCTQALVEIGISLAQLAGAGRMMFLVKDGNGVWVPRIERLLWIC